MLLSRWFVLPLSLFVLTIPGPTFGGHAGHPDPVEATCQTAAFYSPHGGTAAAIGRVLATAERRIWVAAYSLTHADLVASLAGASARGVEVVVKADKVQSAGQAQQIAIAQLQDAGVIVEVSTQSRLLHDKFAVVDERWVITGSFNWTASAENRNRENVLILDCPDLAQNFAAEWVLILPDAP